MRWALGNSGLADNPPEEFLISQDKAFNREGRKGFAKGAKKSKIEIGILLPFPPGWFAEKC
jgi:hypothetical protein